MAPRVGRAINARITKPVLRAYALGYLTATTPRLLPWLSSLPRKDIDNKQKFKELVRILLGGLGLNRFPTFCAALVGGATWLPLLCYQIYSIFCQWSSRASMRPSRSFVRLVRFFSAFVSAWIGFQLLNWKRGSPRAHSISVTHDSRDSRRQGEVLSASDSRLEGPRHHELAGRTLDLTLFSFVRALDVVACIAWDRWKSRRKSRNRWTRVELMAPQLADAGIFAGSAAAVMWAWFYLPERLPRSYAKWIGEAAQVDSRLIEALRRARRGEFIYGKDTGQAPLLGSMCEDYGWPIEWGDPATTIPIPCEMVHMGCGPSCEWHAVSRFLRTFRFALATYLPLQLLLRVRSRQPATACIRAIKDAMRSSSFLALFVSIFYYSVCLARTRLGPRLFGAKTVTPMMWDSGLCVGAGCLMCGWSILAESPHKRQEIAFFVAPRAAATLLPRRYDKKYLSREQFAFALSAAIVLTCIQERPEMVRGVFGRVLASVMG
ncbi:hypothetical protein VTN77DRAFT_4855 [Rasamsonia byssochlamydoides]|uniref:uncharacterized protein n=1 Tax=Rasamsonia byssochlamydoides TaxID=89139 RepID=UPI0037443DAD